MKWFKKKEVVPNPPAPCGNDEEHYHWTNSYESNFGCPVCAGIAFRRKQEAKLQHDAEVYAKAIADEFERRGLKL